MLPPPSAVSPSITRPTDETTALLLLPGMENAEELTSKYSPSEAAPASGGGVRQGRGRCCVRYGRTWVLCSLSRRYGLFPRTCHVGPHWAFMLVTYFLALGPGLLFLVCVPVEAGDGYARGTPANGRVCWAVGVGAMRCLRRRDDLLLGFQIVLIVSMAVTTASFTMVACSDPGVIFEDYTPASVREASDVERGIICGGSRSLLVTSSVVTDRLCCRAAAQCEIRRPLTASHCADCGVCVNEVRVSGCCGSGEE